MDIIIYSRSRIMAVHCQLCSINKILVLRSKLPGSISFQDYLNILIIFQWCNDFLGIIYSEGTACDARRQVAADLSLGVRPLVVITIWRRHGVVCVYLTLDLVFPPRDNNDWLLGMFRCSQLCSPLPDHEMMNKRGSVQISEMNRVAPTVTKPWHSSPLCSHSR